jgi:hypothetical protein
VIYSQGLLNELNRIEFKTTIKTKPNQKKKQSCQVSHMNSAEDRLLVTPQDPVKTRTGVRRALDGIKPPEFPTPMMLHTLKRIDRMCTLIQAQAQIDMEKARRDEFIVYLMKNISIRGMKYTMKKLDNKEEWEITYTDTYEGNEHTIYISEAMKYSDRPALSVRTDGDTYGVLLTVVDYHTKEFILEKSLADFMQSFAHENNMIRDAFDES